MSVLFLALGFLILIKGADWLVDGSASLAKRLNVSDLMIGLTVVAFGTSAPELFVNIFAVVKANPDIAIGNIVGSNIVNVLLILGISAWIFPLKVTQNTVWKEIPLSVLAAVMVFVLSQDALIDGAASNVLSRVDGIVLLAFFVIFMYYVTDIAKRDDQNEGNSVCSNLSFQKSIIWVLIGLASLVLGAHIVVKNAIVIAQKMGVSDSFIGLTIVAVGTSLPELATSVVAACKKNADIAVGNVVGSNIFNVFFILGLSAFLRPLPFQGQLISDLAVLVASGALLFVFMFTGGRKMLDRWEGVVFVICYIAYVAALVYRG
ncbi:MAG TPA: calcium/sodium antiporter [Candidatus Omnitrophota bacterium]|jgi:cation:H+ antiporter|nr:calcium/sodium antiporter [Candidatus Omnitrophota bacterium]